MITRPANIIVKNDRSATFGHIAMKLQFLSTILALTFCLPLAAQKFDNLAQTPPMGWNSWNTFHVAIDEATIKSMADIMVSSGMKDAGYEYLIVDDGWEALVRDEKGDLLPDPAKFPRGMKVVADYVHSKGLKFGIHNCAGNKTCNGMPGGRGHEYQDARLYALWGVDYLKYDWCEHGTADAKETYRTMRDALHAAKRPVVFSLCEWGENKPWLWAQDTAHLWRTTGDIRDCRTCTGEWDMGWEIILEKQVGLEQYAGPGHWNDPDMLEVGNHGLTLNESRAHFSLWCMLAAPLMAGNDLRKMMPETLKILTNKEAIAIDQDALGKQGYRFANQPGHQTWVKELANGRWAICYYNSTPETAQFVATWANLYFMDRSKAYSIRDVWAAKDLGTTADKASVEFDVPSVDVVLLVLTPVK
jgi:alpha-galactosidase